MVALNSQMVQGREVASGHMLRLIGIGAEQSYDAASILEHTVAMYSASPEMGPDYLKDSAKAINAAKVLFRDPAVREAFQAAGVRDWATAGKYLTDMAWGHSASECLTTASATGHLPGVAATGAFIL